VPPPASSRRTRLHHRRHNCRSARAARDTNSTSGQYACVATYDTTFEVDAPAARVWSALTEFPRYGEWNPFLPSLTGDASVGSTLAIALVLGEGTKPMNVSAKVLKFDAERRFTWQDNLGAEFLFKGFREFTLDALGPDKTQVRHVESITGLVAPVFHAVKKKGLQAHHDGFNACLAQSRPGAGSKSTVA
jgi:hypothetical protein